MESTELHSPTPRRSQSGRADRRAGAAKSIRLLLLGVLTALASCGTGAAGPLGGFGQALPLAIPVRPVADTRIPPAPLPARLDLPDGPGPFPVVILLHGCGGIGRGVPLNVWARRLNGWGYGTLIVDSFAPRNIASVCAPAAQPLVTANDRAGDVINAALFLQTQNRVDPNRIGVIGFSHGGGTAATVTRKVFDDLDPGLLKAVVDYYGPCRQAALHGRVPLLVLAGEDDTWGDPARTCTNFGMQLGPDQPFQVVTYPDTVHAFDNAALTRRTFSEGHPLEYNATSAADSYARVHEFLDRWLGQKT
jgi:dienelactone hydrolase